ncbi:DASH family cryptochrome [Seonamhaeicola marinus]|uniref:Cryptochrome DASH n=1 Tax=Seonamhaeicola marinus TaxID=1912246 RepID=A0A5D0I673_9FLAO|nr:DASH family cryptochrome [Seonamhaeicola marinus]TYA78409.1 DASH family cryptochrome [Seonamhaeicola marinus]
MQKKQNNIGLVWFTTNLRVQDNLVLAEAIQNNEQVLALYCFDPRQFELDAFGFKKTEKFRAKFLIETITNLRANLKAINIELLVFHDKPEYAIPKVIQSFPIDAIYFQREWTRDEEQVFNNVVASIPQTVETHPYFDQFLYHPEDIGMSLTHIPNVFTNFRKNVEKYSSVRPSIITKAVENNITIENNTTIPSLDDLGFYEFETHRNSAFPFKGGESAALERLNHYFFETKQLGFYKKTRNGLLGTDYSSKLSSWLANGSISARTIYWEIKRFEETHYKNQSTYWLIFELIWRDYFKYIALKYGNDIFKLRGILNTSYKWRNDSFEIKKWLNGETQSTFVNANMIELKETGWMSNRGRQNVASYFAKDLGLDWRIGAAYFESLLIDYDVHSNYGNWMYVSGVGNDQRNRTFNVNLQADRYDANGKYQNQWLQATLF